MTRVTLAALVAALAALVAVYAPNAGAATASTQASATPMTTFQVKDSNCPAPFNLPWYSCELRPAEMKTINKSSSTSEVHITTKSTVTKSLVKSYEMKYHVIATINEGSPMSGPGCIDPTRVKSWGFHAGDTYKDTDYYHNYFLAKWPGVKVCDWRIVTIGGVRYVKGWKSDCHNGGILIPIRHALPQPTLQVIVFKSKSQFLSDYDRKVKKTGSSTSSHVTYPTCSYLGLGWGVAWQNGAWLCFKPSLVPVTPTQPTTPTPAPKAYCTMPNGQPYYGTSAPSGYVLQNGFCVVQTQSCSAGMIWDGMECIQITVVCGNVGDNNGGNCNNNQPPPTPAAKPTPGLAGLTFPQEIDITTNPQNPTTSPFCVTVTGLPAGKDVVVTFSLNGIGSFTGNPKEITTSGSGSDQACVTFVSPTETGSTSVTAVAYDKTDGTSSAPLSNPKPFPIVNPNNTTTRPGN